MFIFIIMSYIVNCGDLYWPTYLTITLTPLGFKPYLKNLFRVLISGRSQRNSPISMLDPTLLHGIFHTFVDELCQNFEFVPGWDSFIFEPPHPTLLAQARATHKKEYRDTHKDDWKQMKRRSNKKFF